MASKKKILIAEDDRDLIILYRLMLGSGYEIIEAVNGREAVELFKTHQPDLTLMDIKMPVMTGSEAIEEIVSHSPSARFIIVTAFKYSEEKHGVPVLRKGFSRDELLAKIEGSLQSH